MDVVGQECNKFSKSHLTVRGFKKMNNTHLQTQACTHNNNLVQQSIYVKTMSPIDVVNLIIFPTKGTHNCTCTFSGVEVHKARARVPVV